MNLIEILLTAFSLSLDAVAIAIAASALRRLTLKEVLLISGSFGFFQFAMPILGLVSGSFFTSQVGKYGPYVGFIALLGIGLKMLKESLHKHNKEEVDQEKNITRPSVLLTLSLATSIDALVVGVTFNFINIQIPLAVISIGIITFLMSLLGTWVGKNSRNQFGNNIEILGSLILIALAFKILFF